jgi:predicted nucleic acid-binding protein
MSDRKTFIDSNVILYLYSDNDQKKEIVKSLLHSDYTISTQVVNENVNVCLRKLKLGKDDAFDHGRNLLSIFNVAQIYPSTISLAFTL